MTAARRTPGRNPKAALWEGGGRNRKIAQFRLSSFPRAVFPGQFSLGLVYGRAGKARRQGRKTPRSSCRVACWKWSSFYAIAVLLELLDHSGNARALGFGAHLRAPFLVADPPVQNYPEQSVKSVGDGPDGLFVSQARQQLPKRDVKDAALDLDCGLRCLIQQPPHGAVALRRTRTLGLAGALFAPRTCSHPRRQGLLRFKSRCLGTHFGDHLDRRIHPEAGHFRQSLHRVLMLLE